MQVSTNGYISMENTPQYDTLPDFPLSAADKIVAPFADHIDTSAGGSVRYTDFLQSYDYDSLIDDVSDFIQAHTGDKYFYGARMMVAEWNNVPQFDGYSVSLLLHLLVEHHACSICSKASAIYIPCRKSWMHFVPEHL